MKLFESLMNRPPFHSNRIRDPSSGHCRKLGLAHRCQYIVVSRILCKLTTGVALSHVSAWG
ncbi:hypothetical protein SAMN05421858_4753 [Haladaptatus litoreus]|uniref:Uncharacterized protein n=1 Tax=Haladaptatus litoreus TaxID=553468 RepID=A0A1N7F330_9EURY|nr:hypothetical protein SAMN05421858_4753 [Haladaptatus litoreus]